MKFIDLFAGIGGIRIGLEEALREFGIEAECVLSSEIDKAACETYQLNFGEKPSGDVKDIHDIEQFDMLLAGFPCQPFSYAGKRRGFVDTRGTLFFEIERILKKNKPKAFLLENVRGLTTHDNGRTFQTIVGKLEELGYGVTYKLLNSSDFGVPQNRVRIYILGLLGKTPTMSISSGKGSADTHKFKSTLQQKLFDSANKATRVRDILEDTVPIKYHCTEDFVGRLKMVAGDDLHNLHGVRLIDYRNGSSFHSWELCIKGRCTKDEIDFMNLLIANRRKKIFGNQQDGKKLTLDQIQTFYKKKNIHEVVQGLLKKGYLKNHDGKFNPVAGNMSFEVFKFLDPESISITLVTSDAHRIGVVQNGIARRITPRECARIQGFPDTFICHPNDKHVYRQFGNSVSVPVVREVLKDFFRNNPEVIDDEKSDKKTIQVSRGRKVLSTE